MIIKKNGVGRRETEDKNKTMRAWLSKADKQLMRENPPTPYILNQFRSVFYSSKFIFVNHSQKHNMQITIIDLFLEISLDLFLRDLYTTNYSFKKYIYIKF